MGLDKSVTRELYLRIFGLYFLFSTKCLTNEFCNGGVMFIINFVV